MEGREAGEKPTDVSHVRAKPKFEDFLRSQYSSRAFFMILVGNTCLNLATFQNYGDYSLTYSANWGDMVQTVLRYAVLVLPLYIWLVKVDLSNEEYSVDKNYAPNDSDRFVPWAQAAHPVILATLLALKVLHESPGPEVLASEWSQFPSYGLLLLPIVTFFLLRDTKFEALLLTWGIALAVIVFLCIRGQSSDLIYSFMTYAVVTGFVFLDATRQQKKMFLLMSKLQETLKANQLLAVEAQALELRAMIGNVAHDLKTPLTSLLSSIEYLKDVMSSWEELFILHRPEAPPEIMQKTEDYFRAVNGCLSTMQGTNSFMTMTINRCLDYTKASKGFKLVPKLETVSLQAALEMPVQLMRDVQDTIEIQVLPLSAEVCLHVITDKQWLIENLLCLLSNAVKYSHKGCVQVSIVLKSLEHHGSPVEGREYERKEYKEEEKQQMLRVEVQDTGIGLSDEAQKSLFNPFKQAQRLAGGTGLGLFSLAKRIEALHGHYGVTGRPDGEQGSLFWFTIPFRPDRVLDKFDVIDSPVGSLPPSPKSQETSFFPATTPLAPLTVSEPSKFNVLVVDDAPMIVKMTTMLLQRKGHTVQHAVNGADALEKLLVRRAGSSGNIDPVHGPSHGGFSSPRSSVRELPAPPRFDVVLMDLQMPVLDGIEAIRRLRAAEARRDKALAGESPGAATDDNKKAVRQFVVALSANSDEDTRQEALSAGADVFLPKPFTYESFLSAVGAQVPIISED